VEGKEMSQGRDGMNGQVNDRDCPSFKITWGQDQGPAIFEGTKHITKENVVRCFSASMEVRYSYSSEKVQ
jgi:hypothetical protein